ncbi:MAG: TOBE domain-containing protein, partial [Pseudomonadota bacterium]
EKNMIYVTHDQIEAMTLADRIVVMHGGYIQQQGTPEELFKRPANKFVAGFLGMPPMNFLACQVETRDGETFVVGNGFDLRLQGATAQKAAGHSSKDLTLGIRPSDLSFAPNAAATDSLTLHVKVSEYVGAQSVLMCDCGKANVTVEVNSETPMALGETLVFEVNPSRVHLFDQQSEAAL